METERGEKSNPRVWEHIADTDVKTALGKDHTFNALGRRSTRFSQKAGNRPQKNSWHLSNSSCNPEGSCKQFGHHGDLELKDLPFPEQAISN